ncbi:MAG: NAD-binding protein [Desulfotomaculum sp.]|nr:NAD-binding protein [Desulfotomaculum sp.]
MANSEKNLEKPNKLIHIYPGLKILFLLSIAEAAVLCTCIYLIAKYENLTLYEAFYMAMITVFTVGYGDITPQTVPGQKTVILLVVTGVGYVSFFSSMLISTLVEGKILQLWSDITMERKISRLKNHVIVCGIGRTGSAAMKRLYREGIPCVGIDINENICRTMREKGFLTLVGEATDDNVLEKAGIKHASSVIATLPDDGANILITMAAKDLNKNTRVVARVDKPENVKRLKRAGADWVTVLGQTAGMQLAMAASKPVTSNFIQDFLNKYSLKLEELKIEENSELAYKEIRSLNLRQKYGIHIIAIIRDNQTLINPKATEKMLPGDIAIMFGTPEELEKVEFIQGISCPLQT